MTSLPAPEAILEFVACKCRKICRASTCDCLKNELKCTDACGCICEFDYESSEEEGESDEFDDSDAEDYEDY